MNVSFKVIGQNIQAARESKHLTQAQSAKILDMSPIYYNRLEQGERAVTLPQLANIAEAFNVSIHFLLAGCFRAESY